ncbi:MAG: thymidine phosphorylase [Verrucomicrobia bacterium]|nr:thymidine phosphorylase [Verrucomicrobiota bacterium]
MRAVDIIRKKRDGQTLGSEEIDAFVSAATSGTWPDYQLSALLMAIVLRGLSSEETAQLTAAMVHSGRRLDLSDLPGTKVDKHSTGGVGDKTSLILVPLVAACGAVVPMVSGHGLAHTGGTLDRLESIPGFRVDLSPSEFRQALAKVGCAISGQTSEIAPADKKLYALRDVTSTVDSIPLICASIMSKKIAEGIGGLVMDVKCGRGAFMKNRAEALTLAELIVATGRANGVRTEALLTAMNTPLGQSVGNALEVIEALETLKGRGPADVETLSVTLAARMLRLSGQASTHEEAEKLIRAAISSGRGLEKLGRMIEEQGGDRRVVDDYSRLPSAPSRTIFPAERSGYVSLLDAKLAGLASTALGAGRSRMEEAIDPSVGIVVRAKLGAFVRAGEAILELHYRDSSRLDTAVALLRNACRIDDAAPPQETLILETLG